ncbi:hypothetical protein ACFQZ4_05585 [Catellatospora coxensis]|uniref:Uncharacterized protein n=1 Tax=Catellatospora coxensis TaxID=310354 RepID=A0A8J3P651_9ACTN|nr:hypothetical protein [Catellatospora coxensis]GIG05433.1 hypothetical protein Cco03nite_21330 [Catellatospora coxensis]
MSLDKIATPPKGLDSSRLYRVIYLPTYALLLFLLVLVWAGAPGDELDFRAAWTTATKLSVLEIALIAVAVIVLAAVLHPLQLTVMRLLEQGPPSWLGAGLLRKWQRHRKRKLEERAALPGPSATKLPDEQVRQAGLAGSELRRRFPLPDHLVRATALGNVLTAMEDLAGRVYSIDTVVAWPRLYAVLGDRMKAVVDDRRDTMDAAVQLTASAGIGAIAAGALLWGAEDWWWLLTLAPLVLAVLCYAGAVKAALAYAESVHVAYDMHRFDLLKALHLATPTCLSAERAIHRQLSDLWRQGVPPDLEYVSEKEAK